MGMSLGNMARMLRCAGNRGGDAIAFMFELPSMKKNGVIFEAELHCKKLTLFFFITKKEQTAEPFIDFDVFIDQDKIADFEMKLMDIDSKHLGVPNTGYQSIVRMSAATFARICRDLGSIGEPVVAVVIFVTKEGVKFSTRGDIETANIICRQDTSVDKPEDATIIKKNKSVSLTFALRYMNSFTKVTPLVNQVRISLSSDPSGVVEYKIVDMGYVRFHLAPKLKEEEENETYATNWPPQAETKPKVEPKAKSESKSQMDRMAVEEIDDAGAGTKVKPEVRDGGCAS
ncbi:proliferating cell nuclear antigen-like [Syzygium oleosum]|uniref:proliferating cell nuclear antigen-like n=1 Tax=Syzygium oleosum TaxID=219896 RepID=UPI0011D274F0|nr:proliferating cell nuclear antigen-like [Syzygium oleosum]